MRTWKDTLNQFMRKKKHSFLNSVSLKDENFDIPDEKLILDSFVKSYHKIDSEDMIIPDFDPEVKMAVNNETSSNELKDIITPDHI